MLLSAGACLLLFLLLAAGAADTADPHVHIDGEDYFQDLYQRSLEPGLTSIWITAWKFTVTIEMFEKRVGGLETAIDWLQALIDRDVQIYIIATLENAPKFEALRKDAVELRKRLKAEAKRCDSKWFVGRVLTDHPCLSGLNKIHPQKDNWHGCKRCSAPFTRCDTLCEFSIRS
jgi:hypothetical protein